ncbi:MAG: transporter substrate-binding domain-containing protein [Pseudomonadota bacterium]
MRVCRWWWLCLLLGLPVVQAEQDVPAEIRLVSEVWEGHTDADGTGLAWDILRQVFEPAGVKLLIQSMPYTRSIGLVKRGEADAWVGSYRNEVSGGVFYPHWHYDDDQITALGLASGPVPTMDRLGDFRLVWVRGYNYQLYLPNLIHYREIERRSGILSMLSLGHADFYLDASTEVDLLLENVTDKSAYRVTDLVRLPLFLGFTDNPRGHALAALYDRRMQLLVKNGSLRPLFARWQQPYPFDK